MRVARRIVVGVSIAALAVGAAAEEIRVLGNGGVVVRFDSETGQLSNYLQVSGLAEGERIEAVATGGPVSILYGLTEERLYLIDALTGAAMPAGPRFESRLLLQRNFAFAFHPVTGVARLLVGTHPPGANPDDGTESMRLDPRTATIAREDPQTGSPHALSYAAGDPNEGLGPVVTLAAYHPVVSDTSTLYGIDTVRRTLVRIGPAGDAGFTAADDVVTTIAPLSGLPADSAPVALEAQRDGTVLLTTVDGGDLSSTGLWSLDLATGAATALPRIGLPLAEDLARSPAMAFGGAQALVTEKTAVTVDHRRRNADKVQVVGRIGVPGGGWEGKTVQVDFGGIVREFAMDVRGHGGSRRESFRISGRPRGGIWKFKLLLRGDDFGRALGIDSGDGLGAVTPVVDLFVRDPGETIAPAAAHRATPTLGYRTKKGRTIASQ